MFNEADDEDEDDVGNGEDVWIGKEIILWWEVVYSPWWNPFGITRSQQVFDASPGKCMSLLQKEW